MRGDEVERRAQCSFRSGAAGGLRTPDARPFKTALYQLSYRSMDCVAPSRGFEPLTSR